MSPPLSTAVRERRAAAAARYQPAMVDLLLVAEAHPPARTDTSTSEEVKEHDALFGETVRALLGEEPSRKKHAQLAELKRKGVFLIDLKPDPVSGPHEDLSPYVPDLVARAQALRPSRVILIKANVFDLAFWPLRRAGLPVVQERIPFPGSGHQRRFRERMQAALQVTP